MSVASHTIIGFGAVGNALTRDLLTGGEEICSVVTHRPARVNKLIVLPDDCEISNSFHQHSSEYPHFIWLTVPDDVIESKVDELLADSNITLGDDTTFIHCSGSLGLDVLEKAKAMGFHVASLHPLQTFSQDVNEESLSAFKGIYASVLAGDEITQKRINQLCNYLGISPLHVSEREKKQIHLSATIACNYLTTLLDIAQRQLPESGDFSIKIFEPLLKKTIEQNLRYGPSQALSGPVRRGDISTIKTHLEFLKNDDVVIYKVLGDKTLQLVSKMNSGHKNIQQIFRERE
jgi:predicted short-subunit dehydrogenase-like oxidoreductase (DUF2520 family)